MAHRSLSGVPAAKARAQLSIMIDD